MAPGTPTLRRQGTAEFLGALLRSESAHDVAQEADVDDGRVGDADEDARRRRRRRVGRTRANLEARSRARAWECDDGGSGQSARGLPVDPFSAERGE